MTATDQTAMDPEQITRRWIEDIVLGLDLCPFVASVLLTGRVRYAVETATGPPALLLRLAEETRQLEEGDPAVLSTTLLIAPHGPVDFEEFHGLTGVFEDWLEEVGLTGVFQVVSFHPRFRFADSQPGDLSVYVNRAPFPLWHILREEEVSAAISAYKDKGGIRQVGARNSRTLQALGPEGIRARFGAYLPEEALPAAASHR